MPKPNKDQDLAQQLKKEFKKGNFKPSQLRKSRSQEELLKPNPPELKKVSLAIVFLCLLNLVCPNKSNNYGKT
ncbi:MAG: hypothetical protein NY202_00425 [Mollicutes bacterium UO1]